MNTVDKRRCGGTNKRGDPCAAIIVGADGYCMVHSPTSSLDMREIGRRGGSARTKAAGNESLRDYLRREVPPSQVWAALEAAMQGKNESAKVAAVKVLAQELYEPERDQKDWGAAVGAARSQLIERVERLAKAEDEELRLSASEWADRVLAKVKEAWPPDPAIVTQGAGGDEHARAMLGKLFELGLLRPGRNWEDAEAPDPEPEAEVEPPVFARRPEAGSGAVAI